MTGQSIPSLFKMCWKYIGPLLYMVFLVCSFLITEPLTSRDGALFPNWAYGLGWAIALSGIVPVPLWAIIKICLSKGPILKRLRVLWTPAEEEELRTRAEAEVLNETSTSLKHQEVHTGTKDFQHGLEQMPVNPAVHGQRNYLVCQYKVMNVGLKWDMPREVCRRKLEQMPEPCVVRGLEPRPAPWPWAAGGEGEGGCEGAAGGWVSAPPRLQSAGQSAHTSFTEAPAAQWSHHHSPAPPLHSAHIHIASPRSELSDPGLNMSELSVNDHLEGILSDFEALKRSFDIEDEEDIPTFSSPSLVCSPLPTASPHYYLNHTKPKLQSPTRPYPSPLGPPQDHHSPTSRPRAVVASLSFNKGTPSKPLHSNGTCVTRAASFQSRLSPNGYSAMFGAGSDNDSLHSSTSSLEYSGGGSKLLSYPSPRTPEEYPLHIAHQQPPDHRKSKPIPDLHSPNGDAGGAVGRSGASERLSPGFKFANSNANWNGRFRNNSSFGEDIHSFNNHSPKSATPASQRKLNKFPLDLDSIVTGPSVPSEAMSPRASVPPRSPGSGMVSSSASLSSLDSSDTPPLYARVTPPLLTPVTPPLYSPVTPPLYSPVTPLLYSPVTPPLYSPVTPPGSQRVPRVSPCPVPLSPAQTPRLQLLGEHGR
ncbi:DNA-directed RNA polymerase II subunit RPB1-like [Periophthalmus magnuspinnatus]|uniref:DNA-directed RNA polymerase II subunit RPB1-like n=1 Tax=Periophthalmus magnuspinnatus TaxID=409849 RepID=UPI0024371BF4|nr:DNA-directed RNA polymerase II subunit RPB1-like [Periophthalmus magnuspinnatus]